MKQLWILLPCRTCVYQRARALSTIGKGKPFPLKLCGTAWWWSRNISIKLPKGLPIVELLGCVLSRLIMGCFQSWASHHPSVSFRSQVCVLSAHCATLPKPLPRDGPSGFHICAFVHTIGMCAYVHVHVSVAQALKCNNPVGIITSVAPAASKRNPINVSLAFASTQLSSSWFY